jgi:DNA primase
MKYAVNDDFVDRLRSECDIVNIISEYVTLKKKGKNYWGCCPFHSEKTPSFSVTPDKGFFYCFGCQAGGNIFNFIMRVENVGFFDAVKLLARKLNIPLPEKEKSVSDRLQEQELAGLYAANEFARDFFSACLKKTNYGQAAREYLTSRGISAEAIDHFKIGFAPPAWDKLVQASLRHKLNPDFLVKAGLIAPRQNSDGYYDRFRGRIMFPICNGRGLVVGFGGRVLDASQPKYLNSPESAIFNKRHVLYGFDMAYKFIKETGQAIIVEGYMDLIAAHTAGVKNAVASLGTAFTLEQARLLMRSAQEIILAYDSDSAGQNAVLRAQSIVQPFGARVKVLSIPDGKDPDEFIRKRGANAFKTLIGQADNFIDYQIRTALASVDYHSLEGKVSVVTQIIPALALLDNAVAVNGYITKIAQRLAIDENAIRAELNKYLHRSSQKDKNVKNGENAKGSKLSANAHITAAMVAERQIIRLMCDDQSLIPYLAAQITPQDLQIPACQEIIKSIFDAYNTGKPVEPAALSVGFSTDANNELSHIMLIDSQCQDVVQTVDDCIKTIRLARLNELYEQHRLRADELERMGDSGFLQELAQSQRIKHEINKIHQS